MASFSSVVAAIILCAAIANAHFTMTNPTPSLTPTTPTPSYPPKFTQPPPTNCVPPCPPVSCRCPAPVQCPAPQVSCKTILHKVSSHEKVQQNILTSIMELQATVAALAPTCSDTFLDICQKFNVTVNTSCEKSHLTQI